MSINENNKHERDPADSNKIFNKRDDTVYGSNVDDILSSLNEEKACTKTESTEENKEDKDNKENPDSKEQTLSQTSADVDVDLDIDHFNIMFDEIKRQSKEDKRNKLKIKQDRLKHLQESRSPIVAAKLNVASKIDDDDQKKALKEAKKVIEDSINQSSQIKDELTIENSKIDFENFSGKESIFSKVKRFFSLDEPTDINSDDDPWIIYPDDPEPSSLLDLLPSLTNFNKHTSRENIVKVEENKRDEKNYEIKKTQDFTQDFIEASSELNESEPSIENELPRNIIVKQFIKYKKKSEDKNSFQHLDSNKQNAIAVPPKHNENDKTFQFSSGEDLKSNFNNSDFNLKKQQPDNKQKSVKTAKLKYNPATSSANSMPKDYKAMLKLAGNIYKKSKEEKIVIFSGNLENILLEECNTCFKDKVNNNDEHENSETKKKKIKKFSPKEEIKDYTDKSEADCIKNDILKTLRRVSIRTFVSLCALIVCTVLLLMHQIYNPAFPKFTLENNVIYISISLICLLLCTVLCRTTIINGLNSLFKFKGNSDSAVAFADVTCIIQCIVALMFPNSFQRLGYSIYAVLVILGLFLNSRGKLKVIRRIQLNFKFISSDDQKYAAKIFTDKKQLESLLGNSRIYEPVVAYQRRTEFLSDFLKLSYEPDPLEITIGHTAPTCALIAIAAFLLTLFFTKDIVPSISVLSLVACMSIPMTCILATNSQLLSLSKNAGRHGAMIVGYSAVKQFCDTNLIVINANELYPANSITLHGIKSFNNVSIDKVLLEASAVLKRANSPLSKALDKILNNKQDVLPVVVNHEYLDNLGIKACVKGHTVLIGNRKLLENNNIRPPKKEIEMEYLKKDRYLTYVAIDNVLCAMFIASYTPNRNMMFEMQRLENNGVGFLITTHDPNITSNMISEHFKVFFRSIKVLNSEQAKVFLSASEHPELSTRAYLATKGKTISMARFISACIRIKSNINASIITQTMTIALSICLTLLLSLYAGVEHLRALEVSIYSLFWIIVNLLVPKFRKP